MMHANAAGSAALLTLGALAIAATATLTAAPATPVERVPDPRPVHHVVDLTGTLTDGDVAAVDAAAGDAASRGELFVVMVSSTEGVDSRRWATQLFNRLRIDPHARNRGVLLMAALDDRRAEIVVGDGYAPDVTRETERIMRDVVVARFAQGDARGAMVRGARALVDDVVLRAPPPPARLPWLVWLVVALMALVWLSIPLGVAAALVGPTLWRRRPRFCSTCRLKMERVADEFIETHLNAGERCEHRLGSVDFTISRCRRCGVVEKERAPRPFARDIEECPQCHCRTLRVTVTSWTHPFGAVSASADVDERCEHCGYTAHGTRTIAIPTSSSSHDFPSSGGGGGDTGGSSSGRGSSGSW